MYEIETNIDAYVRGFLNNTLIVYKKKSPTNSTSENYYQIFDQDGLIEIFFTEDELVDVLEFVRDEIITTYSFSGSLDDQITFEYD